VAFLVYDIIIDLLGILVQQLVISLLFIHKTVIWEHRILGREFTLGLDIVFQVDK